MFSAADSVACVTQQHADLTTGKWEKKRKRDLEPANREVPQLLRVLFILEISRIKCIAETLLKKPFPSRLFILLTQIPVFNVTEQPVHHNHSFLIKFLH